MPTLSIDSRQRHALLSSSKSSRGSRNRPKFFMNIETLLQAAQILESQQSIPPKKRLAKNERSNGTSPVPTAIISSSLLKTDSNDEVLHQDFNLNAHHQNHMPLDDDDDDDADDLDETSNSHPHRTNDLSTSLPSKPHSTTSFRDREIHNRLEKHRRAHLKDCFDCLKAEVPCQRDRKITNLQVLNLAIKYIQTLTRKERRYEDELTVLTTRNAELKRRLNSLITDLNSSGHNVDAWLANCTEIDHSISTDTASEAEMYRTVDENDEQELHSHSPGLKPSPSFPTHRKSTSSVSSTRSRARPSKRKLQTIPTTNLLHSLSPSIPMLTPTSTCSENLLDFAMDSCNLLSNLQPRTKESLSFTPISDIRYDIVDMFTKGTTSHLHHHHSQPQPVQGQAPQQVSPLPSIASLMNRHSSQASPVVSPTKQTIGINTDPLTTSTTNILHQPVATS